MWLSFSLFFYVKFCTIAEKFFEKVQHFLARFYVGKKNYLKLNNFGDSCNYISVAMYYK